MGLAGRRWRCLPRRRADVLRLQRSVEPAVAFGAGGGCLVLGVPPVELPLTRFLGVSPLVFGGAGVEFGEGTLGAGDAVGCLVRGGDVGPVVLGAGLAFRFGSGYLAHVGEVGLNRPGESGGPVLWLSRLV